MISEPENIRTDQEGIEEIIAMLPYLQDAVVAVREILLANLVMIGEIPAPTFEEQRRVQFIEDRFTESGLQNSSTDEMDNALGILPGLEDDQNILIVAHTDTVFPASVDHTITLQPDLVIGPGVGDNSLGVAVMVTLPTLLDLLDIQLKSNLILMGATRSLGRGDLKGLRFFLSNSDIPIQAGVCLEGLSLGRFSHDSIGMLRGEINCNVPEEYDWTRFGAVGAIVTINEVVNKILQIPLPRRPRSTIVLGSIEGGQSINTIATNSVLRFEIRSESETIGREIQQQIEDITAEVSSMTGGEVSLEIFARRKPGGISFSHPLAKNARHIMRALQIPSRKSPSISELSAFIDRNIPAISVGISYGDHQNQLNETVRIEPMFTGLAQLIGILQAIDGGYCIES